jgi:hypothetical protein
MNSLKYILIILLFLSFSNANAQTDKKVLSAVRVDVPPTIDGELSEVVWKQAVPAANFVMMEPGDGTLERKNQKTLVYILYDNSAIYVGARMYDNEPDKILKELGQRDDDHKNADLFIFSINPYNDGQQVFNFKVTAAGVQIDTKYADGDDDDNWNAVWKSEVKIDDKGWVVEMKIPYSELRFPEQKEQVWGLNILRRIKRTNEEYTWNYIDKKVGEFTQHYGELYGINNIQPPVRLSFMPYISSVVENYDAHTNFNYNGGMDLKYGINESFTLDMTLIPDFSQAAYDEEVLNLGPFEIRYNENRQFFTEGTELFSKGGLFYSRRIGGTPSNYYNVEDIPYIDTTKVIVSNPSKTPMVNATKISGRTRGGLGIGVFNAITNKTVAKVRDVETDDITEIETEPWANYNVLVLDQRFNGNSSVTLINTNVTRSGEFRDANVTGGLFDLSNKSNSYRVFGESKVSQVFPMPDSSKFGMQSTVGFEKTKGKFRFENNTRLTTDNYDNTDLGFMRYSNIWEIDSEISYQIFEPVGAFNSYKFSFGVYHDRQFKPDHFIKVDLNISAHATTRGFLSFGGEFEVSPGGKYDFYEPRVEGRYLKEPFKMEAGSWFSTDYRKKLALNMRVSYKHVTDWDKNRLFIKISPRYRINDKLVVNLGLSKLVALNDVGWVDNVGGDIIMGIRDVNSLTSSLSSSFTFNNKMSINLSFRHYWADIAYIDYKKLANDGSLVDDTYNEDHDITFNSWNVDLSYSWWFAPGSELSILYRNSLLSSFNGSGLGYFDNIHNMFENPLQNMLSVKLSYYIDYNSITTMFK